MAATMLCRGGYHPPEAFPPFGGKVAFAEQMTDEGFLVLAPGYLPAGRACAAGAPISSRRNRGKEGPGGFAHPGPPSTGVHGGGGLYGQGRDRACIAARFPGDFVAGAAAPRAARIGITLQALKVAALYQLGPPGRRRCHAAEIPWCLWWLGNSASRMPRPT